MKKIVFFIYKVILFSITVWNNPNLKPISNKTYKKSFTYHNQVLLFWFNDKTDSSHVKKIKLPKFMSHFEDF